MPVLFAVVLALSAVASASASASSWYAGGTELASSAPLTASAKVTEKIKLFSAIGVTIECVSETVETKVAEIVAHSGGQIEHLVFAGCDIIQSGCGLASTKIESKPLTMEAALGSKSPEDTVLLKPKTGTVFAEYEITGENCGIAGLQQIKGKAKVTMPKGREELAEQEVVMHTGSGELTTGYGNMDVEGKFKTKLASGKAWSFH
jgi:hypothetical protein